MIRNEAEYQEASKRLFEELGRLDEHRANMQMTVDGIKRLAESE